MYIRKSFHLQASHLLTASRQQTPSSGGIQIAASHEQVLVEIDFDDCFGEDC